MWLQAAIGIGVDFITFLDPLVLDADPFLEYSVLSDETLDELLLFVNDLTSA